MNSLDNRGFRFIKQRESHVAHTIEGTQSVEEKSFSRKGERLEERKT